MKTVFDHRVNTKFKHLNASNQIAKFNNLHTCAEMLPPEYKSARNTVFCNFQNIVSLGLFKALDLAECF